MTCPHCAGHGLIRVAYESGEADDLAVCTCPSGQKLRGFPLEMLLNSRGMDSDVNRAGLLEDFSDDVITPLVPTHDFIEAGKVRPGARL